MLVYTLRMCVLNSDVCNYFFYISISLINERMSLFFSNSMELDAPIHPEPWGISPESQSRVTVGAFSSPSLLTHTVS